jgi:autotransporter-associated beta strand protein
MQSSFDSASALRASSSSNSTFDFPIISASRDRAAGSELSVRSLLRSAIMVRTLSLLRIAIILSLGVFAAPATAQAQQTWTNNGTDFAWNTPANWSAAVPTATDLVTFNGTAPGTITISTTPATALGFSFTSGNSYTINGPLGLTVGASGITAASVGTNTINAGIALGAVQTWNNGSTNALNIGGNITDTGNFLLTLGSSSAGAINITGSITGAPTSGITVNSSGTGIVTLSGTNTETGATTLTLGILRATAAGSLGAGTAATALTLNGGVLQLADSTGLGTSFGRNTTVGGNTSIISDLTAAGLGTTQTLGTLSIGAQTLTIGAGGFVTSGTAGITFGAVTLSGASTINTNNSLFASGVTTLTTLGSVTGTQNLIIGGTGNTSITGNVTTTTGTLTKNGTGTLTLNGAANTNTGLMTINAGSLVLSSGATFTGAPALTFGAANTGGGTFNFNAASVGANQNLGALSFLGGDGVVQSIYGTSGNASITFGSLAARTSGASGLFIASGGANGSSNKIVLTGVTPGANGIVIGGAAAGAPATIAGGVYFFNTANPPTTGTPSDYAVYDTAGFVRAINFGTDTTLGNTVAAAATTLTAASISQINTSSGTSGAVALSAGATVTGLKFTTGTTSLATSTFVVTTPSILVSGGGATTISGTTGGVTSSTADMVIRTDAATDALTISGVLAGVGITKTGAGILTVSGAANTFTGTININSGTYAFGGNYSNADPTAGFGAAGARNIVLNGGTLKNVGSNNWNPVSGTKSLVTGLAGGTYDMNGQQLTFDDASQLSGTGNLTLTNSSATTALYLTGAAAYALSGNLIVDPNTTGTITLRLLGANAAGTSNTIVMANNKSALDLQATILNNVVVGGTGISGAGAIISSATGGGINATISLNASVLVNNANALTFSGLITDNGNNFSITKNGAGTLTLSGANTFTGGVTLSVAASTLLIGNNAALGTGTLTSNFAGSTIAANGAANFVTANAVTLNSNTIFGQATTNTGALTFGSLNLGGASRAISVNNPSANAITFTGPITNGSGLTLVGSGTLALAGTGSFTGPVVVDLGGGTLSVGANALNAVSSISIGANTTTSGLNLFADGIGAPANLATNTTLTLGGANTRALLGFQLGSTSNYDAFNLSGPTGNVTVGAAGAAISLSVLPGFGPAANTTANYNLITTSGGGTISGFANFSLALGQLSLLPTGYNYALITTSTAATLSVTAGPAGNLFWRGDNGNSWNTGVGTSNTNWNNAADNAHSTFLPNATNTVVFSSSAIGSTTPANTTLDQNFSVLGILVNSNSTGAVTVSQGTFGTLTLGGGGITVNTGAPTSTTVNAPIALGAAQIWTVTDAGQTLSIEGGTPVNGIVSGAFGITLAGAGSVTLGGFNTFTGGVTTGAGTLNINNGGSTTTNSALGIGAVNFAAATTKLDNNSGVAQSVLTIGAQTWGGDVTFAGSNSLNLGAGTVNLGTSVRTVTVNGGTLQIGGIISGAGAGIIKAGTGALTLSGANTFTTGGVTLNNGKININAAAALGTGTFVINNTGTAVTIDNTSGASLTATNAMTWSTGFTDAASAPLILSGAVAAGSTQKTITVNGPGLGINTNALQVTGAIAMTAGGLIKTGSGSLSLGNANAGFIGGGVALQAGTLNFGVINGMGAAANTLTISANTAIDGGVVNTNAYQMVWNGNFAFIGSGNLTMAGGAITAAPGTTTITVMANTLTLGGAIQNTNTPSITVGGGGVLALTGVNLYTGTTTINYGAQINLGNGTASGSLNGTTGTPLVLNGAVFNYTATAGLTQNMAGVTVGPGRSVITDTLATQVMALGAITRSVPGGTLEIRPTTTSNISTTTVNTNGILGGWAYFNQGASWAVGSTAGAATTITGLAYPSATTTTSTLAGTTAANYTNLNLDVDNSAGLIAGNITPNSIRFNSPTGFTVTLAAGVNSIVSGGILVTPTAAAGTSTITGGTLTGSAGANGDLIINQLGTTGVLNINSVIADNPAGGSVTALTKSGGIVAANNIAVIGGSLGSGLAGTIVNTFSGGVYLNTGELRVTGSSVAGGNGATGPLNKNAIFLNGTSANTVLNLLLDGDATGSSGIIDLTGADPTRSGVTVNNTSILQVGRLGQGTNFAATVPTLFTTALNKTVQFGPLSFGSAGRTLTVTPSSGYGVEFTGITTLDQNLTTISVGTATASNVVQGLTLSGQVTGTIAGGSWTKAGAGTLVLNNGSNTFTSNIVLSAGTLAFNSDSLTTGTNTPLGNTANTITFTGATGATTLRAYGGTAAVPLSIATSRTINLWGTALANNVIEVAANTTLTLNSAFGGGNSPLTKADNGTLVLAADNGIWAGQLSISAGAVRVTNSGALGISTGTATGNTIVAATGGALQLSGVSIFEQLNLIGNGISNGGALQATGGTTSTTNGLISLGAAATIGSDASSILNIRGGIVGAQALVFAGSGAINVDTTPIGAVTSILKLDSGTTTITTANPLVVGVLTVNAGTLTLTGAGSIGGSSPIGMFGGTLTVDDSVGLAVANRLSLNSAVGRAFSSTGGTFNYIGNAGANSSETLGAITINRGESTFTVAAGAGAGARLVFGAPTRGQAATALFRGSNLGSGAGNGVATIASTITGFTFTGTGTAGLVNKGILPWALVDANASGTGTSFATADTATGNLRALAAGEFVTSPTPGANIVLGATSTISGSFTVNSLTLNSGSSLVINPMQTLTVGGGTNLGGFLNTVSTSISGGLLTNGAIAAGVDMIFHANADLLVNSIVVGTQVGSNPMLTKTGAGIMTLNKANAYIGQTVINQGTLKLAGGNNTIFYSSGNSFFAMNGGTLDLNGNSQQVQGLFTDSSVANAGGTITGIAGSTLVTNSDARNWSGVITGSVAFQRGGSASATTVYSDNNYTGPTLISGGSITLTDAGRLSLTSSIGIDYGGTLSIGNTGTLNNNDRINDAATITLRGGTLTLLGRAATQTTETVGAISIAQGLSTITVTAGGTGVNSADLTLNAGSVTGLSRTAGAIVNFTGTNLGLIGNNSRIAVLVNGSAATTANVISGGLVNNIIPWAVVGGTDFASYIPYTSSNNIAVGGIGALNQSGYAGYDGTTLPVASQTSQNIKLAVAGAVPSLGTAGGYMLNSLNLNGIGLTFTSDANALNLVSGGLLKSGANASIGATVAGTRGVLTSGGTTVSTASELLIYNNANTLTINSIVADNGAAGSTTALVLSNAGTVTLAPQTNSTYTGGTWLNGGTFNMTGAAGAVVIPNAATPANGLILNGAALTILAAGNIGSSNIVTLNGSSTLTLVGNNVLI